MANKATRAKRHSRKKNTPVKKAIRSTSQPISFTIDVRLARKAVFAKMLDVPLLRTMISAILSDFCVQPPTQNNEVKEKTAPPSGGAATTT
jgi:hypothetical protein